MTNRTERSVPALAKPLRVVGIGASAGGLDASTQLLKNLPATTGMTFIIMQHRHPGHESILANLLSRATSMPVQEITRDTRIEPDHVYINPPGAGMTITKDVLHPLRRPTNALLLHHIDGFLASLARDQRSNAIGVILSGMGSDGALGLQAIKAEGGITFAQDSKSAAYYDMPRSAIDSGCVDLELNPVQIAEELGRLGRHPGATVEGARSEESLPPLSDSFHRILKLLRTATGADFSHYRPTAIRRHIRGRTTRLHLDSLDAYATYLRGHEEEAGALYRDLFGAARFFRDPEKFEVLERMVFPKIVKRYAGGEQVRIWLPGVGSGEDAYSVAIAFQEFAENRGSRLPIRIFATDPNIKAIAEGSAGLYPLSIANDISPERLRRFFVKTERGYQVSYIIRSMVLVSRQDPAIDPPFSRMDLIITSNPLRHLRDDLHRKVMLALHYSLTPEGLLWFGPQKMARSFADLFKLEDPKNNIYSKQAKPPTPARAAGKESGIDSTARQKAHHILLQRYAPASVLINAHGEILEFFSAQDYLQTPLLKAGANLLEVARSGLDRPLRSALLKSKKSGAPVRKEGLKLELDHHVRPLNLEVIPIPAATTKEPHFVVIFESAAPVPKPKPAGIREPRNSEAAYARLQDELQSARASLLSATEQHLADTEEVITSNEELRGSNEEFQTVNEELENVKEELEATNTALMQSNREAEELNSNLSNLLSSIQIPIVMVDADLCIQRFTPSAKLLLNLIDADIGRPLTELRLKVDMPQLPKLLKEVIASLRPIELEVQDRSGRWFSLQIRPFRTLERGIEGAVITMVDIDQLKRDREKLRALVELSFEPIIVWQFDGGITDWNQGCEQLYGFTRAEAIGRSIHDLLRTRLPMPRGEFMARLQAKGEWKGELRHVTKDGREMILESRKQIAEIAGRSMVLETNHDITETKRAQLNAGFTNELDFALARITDTDEIVRLATRKLGEYVGANRCNLAESIPAPNFFLVRQSWEGWLEGAPSLAGEYRTGDFIVPEVLAAFRKGQTITINDVATDPRTRDFASNYATFKIGSFICAPILSEGKWEATLNLNDARPRYWRPDEVQLIRDTAVRVWLAVKQSRSLALLRESEVRSRRTMAEQMVAGVAECDTSGKFILVNQRYCDIAGRTGDELLNLRFQDFTHPDDWPRNAELFRRLLENGESFFIEKRYKHKDGSEVWINIHASPVRNAQGQIVGSVAVGIDITDRKRMEQELAAAKDHLAADLDAVSWLQRVSTTFVREGIEPTFSEIVEAAIGITGADKGTLRLVDESGKLAIVAQHGFERPFLEFWSTTEEGRGACGTAFARGERVIVEDVAVSPIFAGKPELKIQLQAGVRAVQSTPVFSRSGKLLGLLSTHFGTPRRPDERMLGLLDLLVGQTADIIERAQAEEELRLAYKRAEAATRAKDEFLSIVSHELRTPLVSILGYTQLLLHQKPNAARIQRVVEVVERNSRAQLQLIEDLLDTSRIIAGKLKLDVQPLDLRGVIEAALDVVRPAADAKGIRLRSTLDPHAAQITGDPERLQQAVWNLLSNSIKFTNKGGLVEVTLRRADPYVEIIVRDTGKGIEPDFLPHVFERFRQSDMSSTRRTGGLGLGLALVKHLVDLHGGEVEAASAGLDQGSTFTVRLPVRAVYTASSEECEPIPAENRESLAGIRALVVDDQQDVRTLLTLTLEGYGAKVWTASSGEEALELLVQQTPADHFDVFICDVAMPDEDGYAVMQKVRALPPEKGGDIAAIALTAYGRTEYRVRTVEAGFQMYAVKPVKSDELVAMIQELTKPAKLV